MAHRRRTPEQRSLDSAVEAFARDTGFEFAFGGYASGGTATLTSLLGMRTTSLQGLTVSPGRGLGGRVMEECRSRLTSDYTRSPHISHEYDGPVVSEGIRMLMAVPVLVDGCVRAILYGGSRSTSAPGGAVVRASAAGSGGLGRVIRARDDPTRPLGRRDEDPRSPGARELPTAALEELRASYAELRGISVQIAEPALRLRLEALERRLERLGRRGDPGEPPSAAQVGLSPREIDVLSHVALGGSNAEVGRALGLTEATIKSYLKSATGKLGCSGRHAAVAAARRAGLLP